MKRDRSFESAELYGKLKISSSNFKKFILTFENGRSGRAVHAVTVCVAAMFDGRQNDAWPAWLLCQEQGSAVLKQRAIIGEYKYGLYFYTFKISYVPPI